MTPDEIKQARQSLGLTADQFAAMLGYGHRSRTFEIESGRRNAGAATVRLIRAYLDGYRPDDWPAEQVVMKPAEEDGWPAFEGEGCPTRGTLNGKSQT